MKIGTYKKKTVALILCMILVMTGCQSNSEPEPFESVQTNEIENAADQEDAKQADEIVALDTTSNVRDCISDNGVVASAHPKASEIGVEILKNGGNAVDAAVAVGFALGVLEPNASGIGGGGFMMYRSAETGEVKFIDFREVMPRKASLDQYTLDEDGKVMNRENSIGPKSIAIPGEVAGLLYALETYGTLDRLSVMQPAIEVAKNGFTVSETLSGVAQGKFDLILNNEEMAEVFTTDGLPLMEGDQIVQLDLAETLGLISDQGADVFYKGPLAKKMVEEVNKLGGYLTLDDFENYKVEIRKPVQGNYRGFDIISAPPSSSGGTHVIELLNIMENFDVASWAPESVQSIHVWAEAMKLVYDDRNMYMGDTDFVTVPLEGLQSKTYAKSRSEQIDMNIANSDFESIDPWQYESGSTTHYSIIDKEGNMVSVTKTINHFFGSGIIVPGTGIIMNDEIADFSFNPESPNFIEAGKRPLSSMSPSLLMKDGKPYASIGTPGGKRIISTLAWVISRMIDYDMDIQEAINAPRISQYEKGSLKLEGIIPVDVADELETMGHKIIMKKENDLYFGGVHGIVILEEGKLHGGADSRRDGQALGY